MAYQELDPKVIKGIYEFDKCSCFFFEKKRQTKNEIKSKQ